MLKIGVINGPNINRLGMREPHIYGTTTLTDLEQELIKSATDQGALLTCFQSNHEGSIIDTIHQWTDSEYFGVIINPAAYTHTSVAIRDALAASSMQIVEVHISNIHKRESFRHHSYISPLAQGVICGLGIFGYHAALSYLLSQARPCS